MSDIILERPGVYSSYDASAVVSGGRAVRTVGVAARAVRGDVGKVVTVTGYTAGVAVVGEDAAQSPGMSTLLRLLFANGAATVLAVRVDDAAGTADYEAAFQALGREEAQILVCDSAELEVQQALRTAVEEASSTRRERIALVGGNGDTAAELVERAAALNSERMVLLRASGPTSTMRSELMASAWLTSSAADSSLPPTTAMRSFRQAESCSTAVRSAWWIS